MRARVGIWLSVLAASELGLAFLTQSFVVAQLGPTRLADAYFSSVLVPQLFFAVLFGPVVSVALPMLSAQSPEERSASARALLSQSMLWTTPLIVFAVVTCSWWTPLFWPGYAAADRPVLELLVRLQLLGVLPASCFMLWRAATYASQRFVVAESFAVLGALGAFVATLLLVPRFGVEATGWVNLGRLLFMLAGLALAAPLGSGTTAPSTVRQEVVNKARPLVAGAALFKLEPLLDQNMSSLARPGDLAVLSFARTLLNAALQILGQAVVAPMTPRLAVLHRESNWRELRSTVRSRLLLMTAIGAAGVGVFAVVGRPLLAWAASLKLGGGGVPVDLLWAVLLLLFGVPIASGGGQLLNVGFYAMGETRLPTKVGVLAFLAGAALKIAAFWYGGLFWLAGATSVYFVLEVAVLWWVFERYVARRMAAQS